MPIEHINKTDTLNEGRVKLNAAIDGANAADVTSQAADTKATQALTNSESTQTQLDTIVIDGDSSVEAAQARVDANDNVHETLKKRADSDYNELTQERDQIGGTTFFYNENGLVSEIITPTKTVLFKYEGEEIQEIIETMQHKEIETTFTHNHEGTINEVNRVVI